MKREERRALGCSKGIDDSEIEAIEELLKAADPGRWHVKDGRIVRRSSDDIYGWKELDKPAESLAFMAKSIEIVPTLIRAIRDLEDAYRGARVEVTRLKHEFLRAREDAELAAINRAEGRTGPEWEIASVAKVVLEWASHASEDDRRHTGGCRGYVEHLLRKWVGGQSIADEIRVDLEKVERAIEERRAFNKRLEEEMKRDASKLREWVSKLEAGEVPPELASQWARATKEERKRYLAERRAAK